MVFRVRNFEDYIKPFSSDVLSTSSGFSSPQSYANNAITKAYLNAKSNDGLPPIDDRRGLLDRGFDLLLTPLYATSGFVKGMVDNNTENNITPIEGFIGGLRAGNPFGEGYEKGEHTYSEVLESMGWKPDTTLGKFAKGAVGLGLDILLDPTTYMTFGTGALIKGTGRAGALATHATPAVKKIAEKYGVKASENINEVPKQIYEKTISDFKDKGYNPDLIERLASTRAEKASNEILTAMKGMSKEQAETIIKSQSKARRVDLSPEQLSLDAEKLAKEYNRLIGLRDNATDITIGLKNMPFGEKIGNKWFGGFGTPKTLKDAKSIQEFGEKTIAPFYAKLRDSIYGSKLGELFSPRTPLYRISKENPAKLYDFLKFIEYTKGLNKDKLNAEKAIRDYAKTALNLSPAEQKEVLELMQDKTIWGKVSSTVKLLDTKEAEQYRKQFEEKRNKIFNEIKEIEEMKKNVDALRFANENEIISAKKELELLESEYIEKLSKIDTSNLADESAIKSVIKMQEDELAQIKHKIETETIPMRDITPEEIIKVSNDWAYEKMAIDKHYASGGKSIDAPAQMSRDKLVRMLSKYIMDDPNYISITTRDYNLIGLIKSIQKGVDKDILKDQINKNPDFYNGRSYAIHTFLGELFGYGRGQKYKSFKELIDDGLGPIIDKEIRGEPLTPAELNQKARINRIRIERNNWLRKFKDAKTTEDVTKIISDYRTQEMFKDYERYRSRLDPSEQGLAHYEDDVRRSRFYDEDRADIKRKTGEFDSRKFLDKKFSLDYHERDELMDRIISLVNKSTSGSITEGQYKWINKITDESERLLNTFFKRPFSELTERQKDLLHTMSVINVNISLSSKSSPDKKAFKAIVNEAKRRAGKLREDTLLEELRVGDTIEAQTSNALIVGTVEKVNVGEGGKVSFDIKRASSGKIVEGITPNQVLRLYKDKQKMSIEDIIASSPTTRNYLERQKELESLLEENYSKLSDVRKKIKQEEKAVVGEIRERIAKARGHIRRLEQSRKALDEALVADSIENVDGSITKIDELYDKLRQMDATLANDDAFESYFRATLISKYGDDAPDELLKKYEPNKVIDIVLSERNVSDKVKSTVKALRASFMEVAQKEISIGKLKQEQVDNLLYDYITHVLTPEGAHLFKNNKIQVLEDGTLITSPKQLEEYKPSITQDLGYGIKWNPYSKTRTIKNIVIDGKLVKNPTIEQINESLRPLLEGKNAFSENVADIYITRMLKHTELMYDYRYMNEMMNTFGKRLDIGGNVEKGYKAVVNYGQLREFVRETALRRTNTELETLKANAVKIEKGDFKKAFEKNILDVIKEMKMTPNILDDLATPMIELTDEQIKAIQNMQPQLIRQVNDAIVLKANQARKIQIAKDQDRFLEMYDKFLHFVKVNQTTVMPSFHIRNKLSNIFNNWLIVGADSANIEMQKQAWKTVRHNGDISKVNEVLQIPKPDGTFEIMHWNELYELAKQHNVIDEGFFAKDLGSGSAMSGKLKNIPAKYDPTDTRNFIIYRKGAEIGSNIENTDRLLAFASMIKQGKSIEEAAEASKKALFDYSDLTAFEMNVMKRILPYYTWLRKNSALQLEQMLEQPKKYQYVGKVLGGIEGMVNEEDRINKAFVNDFAKDWVQTPWHVVNPEGREEPVLWNPNMPFMDLNRIPVPWSPVESAKDLFTQTAPMIKVPVEQALNHNFFFESPIVKEGDNELTRRLDHALSNFAYYGAGKDFGRKQGADLGLQFLNTFGGVKLLSYDYDKYKHQKIQELLEKYKD